MLATGWEEQPGSRQCGLRDVPTSHLALFPSRLGSRLQDAHPAALSVMPPGKLLLSALRRTLTEQGVSLPPRKQGARGCLLLLSLGKGDREPSLTTFAWVLSPRMASEATARAAVPALPFPAEVTAMAPAQAPVKWPQAMNAGTRGTRTDLSPEDARLPPLHLPDTPELGPAPSPLGSVRLCAAGVFPWVQHLFSETLLRFLSPPPPPTPRVPHTGQGSRMTRKGETWPWDMRGPTWPTLKFKFGFKS